MQEADGCILQPLGASGFSGLARATLAEPQVEDGSVEQLGLAWVASIYMVNPQRVTFAIFLWKVVLVGGLQASTSIASI